MKKFIIFMCFILIIFSMTSCEAYRNYHRWKSEYVNDIDEMYKVQDVDNRLYNYEWFYDQYNQIKSTAANAKLLNGDEKTGTLMVLNTMIAEYNSRASQTRNRAEWKGRDLPYNIVLSDVYQE